MPRSNHSQRKISKKINQDESSANAYAVILAGGAGTRLAPISSPECPKQFVEFYDGKSLLQHTVLRLNELFPVRHIILATHQDYRKLSLEQFPNVEQSQIIFESERKNTAASIALTAWWLFHINPDVVFGVFPSDHFIAGEKSFGEAVTKAYDTARRYNKLVTLGIKPSKPSTEYGYIKRGARIASSEKGVYKVARFTEKPNAARARAYCKQGNYLWNSGMFIWRADVLLQEIKAFLPKMYKLLQKVTIANGKMRQQDMDKYFSQVESISIDYGIMERSKSVAVVEVDFHWSDLGSFASIRQLVEEGRIRLSQELTDTLPSTVDGSPKQPPSRRVVKPWGHELIWAYTPQYVGKLLYIKAPHRLSYQYHNVKEESIYLLDGLMDFEYEVAGKRSSVRLGPGDTFHIPSKMRHRMIAIKDCTVLEASTPYLKDVVRLEDAYGRSDKKKKRTSNNKRVLQKTTVRSI